MYKRAHTNFIKQFARIKNLAQKEVEYHFNDDPHVQRASLIYLHWSVPMGDEESLWGDGQPPKNIFEQYGDCIDVRFNIKLHMSDGRTDEYSSIVCFFEDEEFSFEFDIRE